ncbi:UDP-N-acetylmuramoyl-tripeptide--D-alanyl-D-alanine ligase [Aliivibrio kagoshimensis]|uniref:UDP-N-acetylmuramoyl-tripeptide--D-alanyl-D- alanine ligase n=1 Tax=Aliivibrio kagoshimensis TaxID=2910230 RepID=UPI003D0F8C74
MTPFKLSELAPILNAELVGGDATVQHVSTDTRSIERQTLFIALIGERFDAHDFCHQAVTDGVTALLVSKKLDVAVPQLVVKDTQVALGQLGEWVHQQSKALAIALTGSCGKTTVKEMLAEILQLKGKVLATAGNFNNEIGVPLTLLRAEPQDDYSIIELGANHLNEIAYTTQLVKPDIALVNNIAAAHLEGFGSLQGVATAKAEIFQGLPTDGHAVVNSDSCDMMLWQTVLSDKKVTLFSLSNPETDFYASHIVINHHGEASFIMHTPDGELDINLHLLGKHNISNALAAAALSMLAGATLSEVKQGLERVRNVKGRVEVVKLTDTLTLIDDSYNASVPAMKSAAELLSSFQGERWLVLGYMAELGTESLALHRQVGEYAAQFDFENVMTFGSDSKIISELCNGMHFDCREAMIAFLLQQLDKQKNNEVTVLVKGANSSRMSDVVKALKESNK